jgi:hypothetical protein
VARCQMCGAELADAAQRFCGGDTCDRVLQPRARGAAGAWAWLARGLAVAVILLGSLVVARPAHGQVPTAADIAACNEDAPRAIKAGSASPTGGDHARADRARGGTPVKDASQPPAGPVESSDPQIHGMHRAGAHDAAYQAAYRSCMRRKGF